MSQVSLNQDTANKIVQAFAGWHDQTNDGVFTTRAAIACNKLKKDILDFYGNNICPLTDDTNKSKFYKAVYLGHSNVANRRLALFKPAPVWITGPSSQSTPTLCTIDGYLLKLPLYTIIAHKAVVLINAEVTRQKHINTVLNGVDSVAFSGAMNATCYMIHAKPDLADITTLLHIDQEQSFIIALACLMHATVTQHMCDIDAGIKFRDKRGRQAAFDELHASVNTLLYATPYKAQSN